jgi:hypothetical protein
MANSESGIQNRIMLDLSLHGALVWRQQVGSYRYLHTEGVVKIGVPGMADIGAIIPVTITPEMVGKTIGIAAQIEVKTLTGKQRDNQKLWELAVNKRHGIYAVCRSPEEAIKIIKNPIDTM